MPSRKSVRVQCLQCGHFNVLTPVDAIAIGSLSDQPDRRFRQAPPLPRVRKSERACDPQPSAAANSIADHEALITCADQLSEGLHQEKRRYQPKSA